MKGKKALIISVGTGTRPEQDSQESLAHGIAYSIKNQNPDQIFFVVTKESQEKTLPLVLSQIDNSHDIICLDHPDDINKIYNFLSPTLKEITGKYAHVTVDYTSGTKAMTAALTVLASILEMESLSYVTGERQGGIVVKGTETLLTISPYPVIFDKKFPLAVLLFNRYQFDAALEVMRQLENLCSHPDLLSKLSPLKIVTLAYNSWDKFQHKEALSILKQIDDSRFQTNIAFLDRQLASQEKEPFHIADLINNAKRRAEETKYDDAVARLYRVIELIAQYKLRNYGIMDTGNVPHDKIPDSLKDDFKGMKAKIQIGLEKDYKFLQEYGDDLGKRYFNDKTIKQALKRRNDSILAHGVTPVSVSDYEKLLEVALDFAKAAVEDFDKWLRGSRFVKWND